MGIASYFTDVLGSYSHFSCLSSLGNVQFKICKRSSSSSFPLTLCTHFYPTPHPPRSCLMPQLPYVPSHPLMLILTTLHSPQATTTIHTVMLSCTHSNHPTLTLCHNYHTALFVPSRPPTLILTTPHSPRTITTIPPHSYHHTLNGMYPPICLGMTNPSASPPQVMRRQSGKVSPAMPVVLQTPKVIRG